TFALWLTGDAAVAAATTQWLHAAAFAIPLTLVVMAGNGWLRGIQDTRRPLLFVLAGIVPGAVALPALVAQFGLVGSAWANVLGMTITAVLFLICLAREHEGDWQPRWQVMGRQLVLGRDLILRSLSFQVAFLSAAAVAARFGTAPLAAHQILLQLWNFITLVLDSLAIAAQTLTGAALGRGVVAVARRVGNRIIFYSVIFAGVLAAVFAAGSTLIPRIFTTDETVLAALRGPWWLLLLMILLGGVVFAIDGVLLGAGDAAFLRTISILSVLLGFLPGVWLAYLFDGGLIGVWWGLVAFIALRLVAVVWRFQSMRWAVVDSELDGREKRT
ncbi:MAG TPA: MATE family efflux transporter, partial [Corynebacterium sp.]|nr:MATE family efflux transporter [Corynebacterium sp.]